MTTKAKEHRSYALPIAIMFALFFMIAFVTGYQNPLGNVIKELSGGNLILSQLGTFANFIAYAFMGYPAGKILEKKGYRVTALWAVSVGFFGVLITYMSGYITYNNIHAVIVYLIGAFVAGFSMCMLNTVVNPMLNSLGKDQKQGNQLVQFGGSCNSLGATLAPVIVGGLIGSTSGADAGMTIASANPVFYMAMAIFALAFLVLYFSDLPESEELGKKHEKIEVKGAFKYRNFTFGVIGIFCYIGIEVGVANFCTQYLSTSETVITGNVGLSADAIAGTVVGIYWLLMLVGRLIGGAIGGKVSSRAMLTFTSALAIALLVLGIYMPESIVTFIGFDAGQLVFSDVQIPLNAIFLIACGLCTSVMWGGIFNLAVQGLGKYTAVASGIFMTMVCGGGIFLLVQAAIADGSSILDSFWLLVGLSAYLLFYALFFAKPDTRWAQHKETLEEDGTVAEV